MLEEILENWMIAKPYSISDIVFIFIDYFARNGYPQLADTNIKMLNWIYETRTNWRYYRHCMGKGHYLY